MGIIILTRPEMADNAIVLCCSVLMMIMMKPMMLVRILETKKSLFFLKSMSAGAGHNFNVLREIAAEAPGKRDLRRPVQGIKLNSVYEARLRHVLNDGVKIMF